MAEKREPRWTVPPAGRLKARGRRSAAMAKSGKGQQQQRGGDKTTGYLTCVPLQALRQGIVLMVDVKKKVSRQEDAESSGEST